MDKFVVRRDKNEESESLEYRLEHLSLKKCPMRSICAPNLRLSYGIVLPKKLADELFAYCESNLQYYTGDLATVQMFGKTVQVPRKQSAYGDDGLAYTFSGTTLPANQWSPVLHRLRQLISDLADVSFNFVLVNRYKVEEIV